MFHSRRIVGTQSTDDTLRPLLAPLTKSLEMATNA
jgi:hypothetical protein